MQHAKRPRLAVVGAGYWGKNIVRTCDALGNLAVVCDTERSRLDEIARQYPSVDVSVHVDRAFESDVDGAIVALPAAYHASVGIAALQAGKHVLVEKPMALRLCDAERLVAAAETRSLVCHVGHLLLYDPRIVAVIGAAHAGAVGQVRHIRSRRLGLGRVRTEENVWWSFAPHDVAVVLALCGKQPVETRIEFAHVTSQNIADFAYADLTFERDCTAHIEVGWFELERSHRLDVYGSLGVLTFVDDGSKSTTSFTPCRAGEARGGIREIVRGNTEMFQLAPEESLKLEIEAFVRSIETGWIAPTNGRDALAVMQVLSAAGEGLPYREAIA